MLKPESPAENLPVPNSLQESESPLELADRPRLPLDVVACIMDQIDYQILNYDDLDVSAACPLRHLKMGQFDRETLATLRLVSRSFNKLARPLMYRSLSIQRREATARPRVLEHVTMVASDEHLRHVTCLDLTPFITTSSARHLSDIVLALFVSRLPNLRVLEFRDVGELSDFPHLHSKLLGLKSLDGLTLAMGRDGHGVDLKGKQVTELVTHFAPRLRSLAILDSVTMTYDSISSILASPSLRHLSMHNFALRLGADDEASSPNPALLTWSPALQSLHMSTSHRTAWPICYLLIITNTKTLRSLSLAGPLLAAAFSGASLSLPNLVEVFCPPSNPTAASRLLASAALWDAPKLATLAIPHDSGVCLCLAVLLAEGGFPHLQTVRWTLGLDEEESEDCDPLKVLLKSRGITLTWGTW